MLYDVRTYELKPGVLQDYMAAVREVAVKVRGDHGVKLAGWYHADVGTLNRVVHIWAYRDYAHFGSAREKVRSDPRWLEDYLPRVKGMILRQQDELMRAADFFEEQAGWLE